MITKEFLEEQYFELNKSKAEIARITNKCPQTIQNYFKKYNITKKEFTEEVPDKKFGRLKPIKFYGRGKFSKILWLCKCDCGKEVIVHKQSLIRKLTTSCGCYKKEVNHKGYKDLSSSYWRRRKQDAEYRNIEFKITMQYVWEIYEKQNKKCKFTDLEIHFNCNNNHPQKQTASIDRIDSSKGYVEGNIQIVHKVINYIKGFLNDEELICFCNLVANKHRRNDEDCKKNIGRTIIKKI